jgi:hypothetical protein
VDCDLLSCCAVAGSGFEVIIIRLDILGQVYGLSSGKSTDSVEDHRFTVVVLSFPMPGLTGEADVLAAFGYVRTRNLIFGEDRFIGAFGDACSTVNAGVGVDIVPGPFFLGFARDNTFHRTNINTTGVPQAQTGDNVGHGLYLRE